MPSKRTDPQARRRRARRVNLALTRVEVLVVLLLALLLGTIFTVMVPYM